MGRVAIVAARLVEYSCSYLRICLSFMATVIMVKAAVAAVVKRRKVAITMFRVELKSELVLRYSYS